MGTTTDIRGPQLRRALRDQGRTVTWLAKEMGYSRAYVTRVLAGADPLTETFQERALRVLDDNGVTRDLYRGRIIQLPVNIYRDRAPLPREVVHGEYKTAWLRSWLDEHAETTLAAAAEAAWVRAGGDAA